MKIHEVTLDDGSLAPVSLELGPGGLAIVREGRAMPLPEGAIAAVMKRFGAPLDEAARFREVDRLVLRDGTMLRHIRHLDAFDVIARDYLVHEASGRSLCAMATTVAGALEHLARAAARD